MLLPMIASLRKFLSDKSIGFTATNVGFYGPQGRRLRLNWKDDEMILN